MRNGTNPTYQQKKVLSANKLNPDDYLLIKTNKDSYVFRKRNSKETIELEKLN